MTNESVKVEAIHLIYICVSTVDTIDVPSWPLQWFVYNDNLGKHCNEKMLIYIVKFSLCLKIDSMQSSCETLLNFCQISLSKMKHTINKKLIWTEILNILVKVLQSSSTPSDSLLVQTVSTIRESFYLYEFDEDDQCEQAMVSLISSMERKNVPTAMLLNMKNGFDLLVVAKDQTLINNERNSLHDQVKILASILRSHQKQSAIKVVVTFTQLLANIINTISSIRTVEENDVKELDDIILDFRHILRFVNDSHLKRIGYVVSLNISFCILRFKAGPDKFNFIVQLCKNDYKDVDQIITWNALKYFCKISALEGGLRALVHNKFGLCQGIPSSTYTGFLNHDRYLDIIGMNSISQIKELCSLTEDGFYFFHYILENMSTIGTHYMIDMMISTREGLKLTVDIMRSASSRTNNLRIPLIVIHRLLCNSQGSRHTVDRNSTVLDITKILKSCQSMQSHEYIDVLMRLLEDSSVEFNQINFILDEISDMLTTNQVSISFVNSLKGNRILKNLEVKEKRAQSKKMNLIKKIESKSQKESSALAFLRKFSTRSSKNFGSFLSTRSSDEVSVQNMNPDISRQESFSRQSRSIRSRQSFIDIEINLADLYKGKGLPKEKAKRNTVYLAIFLLLIGCSIIFIQFSPNNDSPRVNNQGETNVDTPSVAPTFITPNFSQSTRPTSGYLVSNAPSISPTKSRETLIRERLLLEGVSADALDDPSSPQSKAFTFIIDLDGMELASDAPTLIQRYSMVTLYYSTNGDNWVDRSGWLTYHNECTWYGVEECNSEGMITTIYLSKYDSLSLLRAGQMLIITYMMYVLSTTVFNNLTGELPFEVGLLDLVTDFYVAFNGITSLSPNIGDMESLRVVMLMVNSITGTIPTTFGNLQNMERLNINENLFTGSFPSEIGRLHKLIDIFAYENLLTGSLPEDSYASLTNLGELF